MIKKPSFTTKFVGDGCSIEFVFSSTGVPVGIVFIPPTGGYVGITISGAGKFTSRNHDDICRALCIYHEA